MQVIRAVCPYLSLSAYPFTRSARSKNLQIAKTFKILLKTMVLFMLD